jgi:glycosyltransferase involved in cell wall biosynthesis
VAVAVGGPTGLIRDGETGLLRPASATALAEALVGLAASPLSRARLARNALLEVRGRTWDAALGRLADGYRLVLDRQAGQAGRRVAA